MTPDTAQPDAVEPQSKPAPIARPRANRRQPGSRLDGRSAEARLFGRTKAELVALVGGRPTSLQRHRIDMASWLTVYIAQWNQQVEAGKPMAPELARIYADYSAGLDKILAELSEGKEP